MLRKLVTVAIAAAAFAGAALWFFTAPQTIPESVLAPHTPDLANGRTMFLIGGCSSCHAVPEQEDATRLGGGLALNSPFGVFYVPNISSDKMDGIGSWSEAQFVTAMAKGTSPAGEHLYPALPYTSYQRMRIDDLRDLFAYLKTLPAISGKVRDHGGRSVQYPPGSGPLEDVVPRREAVRARPGAVRTMESRSLSRERPATAPNATSPRNFLGAIIASRRFTGGPSPTGQGGVPDITQGKLHDWKVEEWAETLATGMTADADLVGGLMMEVVANTRQLSAADREAIAVYLKSLSASK